MGKDKEMSGRFKCICCKILVQAQDYITIRHSVSMVLTYYLCEICKSIYTPLHIPDIGYTFVKKPLEKLK